MHTSTLKCPYVCRSQCRCHKCLSCKIKQYISAVSQCLQNLFRGKKKDSCKRAVRLNGAVRVVWLGVTEPDHLSADGSGLFCSRCASLINRQNCPSTVNISCTQSLIVLPLPFSSVTALNVPYAAIKPEDTQQVTEAISLSCRKGRIEPTVKNLKSMWKSGWKTCFCEFHDFVIMVALGQTAGALHPLNAERMWLSQLLT